MWKDILCFLKILYPFGHWLTEVEHDPLLMLSRRQVKRLMVILDCSYFMEYVLSFLCLELSYWHVNGLRSILAALPTCIKPVTNSNPSQVVANLLVNQQVFKTSEMISSYFSKLILTTMLLLAGCLPRTSCKSISSGYNTKTNLWALFSSLLHLSEKGNSLERCMGSKLSQHMFWGGSIYQRLSKCIRKAGSATR